jgi:hypothetical protein
MNNSLTDGWTDCRAAHKKRLAQWRVKWLIEHSTSHQLLRCIDSFVLGNPPLLQAPKRCASYWVTLYRTKSYYYNE